MSEEQYWEGDPNLVVAYRKAHKLAVQQRNQEMWINGMYILKVLDVVLSGIGKGPKERYFDEPIDLFPEPKHEITEEEREEAKQKVVDQLNAWKQAWDKSHKEKADAVSSDNRKS